MDNLGDLDAAVVAAAQLANLEEDDYVVSYIEKEEGFQEKLMRELMASAINATDQTSISLSPLNKMLRQVEQAIAEFGALNDPNHIYLISDLETD